MTTPPLVLILLLGLMPSGGPDRLSSRSAYLRALRPFAPRVEVVAAIGSPDTTYVGKPAYLMPNGKAVVAFDSHGLLRVEHMNYGDGGSQMLYGRFGSWPTAAELRRREVLLKGGRVSSLAAWGAAFVRTASSAGQAYLLPGGYAVVEAMCPLMGATGPWVDRAARITVHRGGSARVRYRAWDEWAALRPPMLSDADIAKRVGALRSFTMSTVPVSKTTGLGVPDGEMGSGMSYRLAWIPDGLVTYVGAGACVKLSLSQPGADRQVGFGEWLGGARPKRK